jgi:molybdate transport system ATP-binding protein
MNAELEAQFVKRFSNGVQVEGNLRQPTNRFSITVLFGPSGCGKTTTLRCLAGLDQPEAGHIMFEQTLWFDAERRLFLTPQQRDIGYLFQEYALFPHLTVAQNIGYGLGRLSRMDRRRRVSDMLDLFQLAGLASRYPQQASGGEQQRIALARVLVRRPRLLLLDEPFSALDQPTREQLRPELRRLLNQFGIPVVLVTHNRMEAMALADHLIVMDQGRVRQQGSVQQVFDRPADVEVARIVGMANIQPGQVEQTADGFSSVTLDRTELLALAPAPPAEQVFICVRPEEIVLERGAASNTGQLNCLPGIVGALTLEGPLVRVAVDCGFPLVALITRTLCTELDLRVGEAITALVKATSIHLVARSGEHHVER